MRFIIPDITREKTEASPGEFHSKPNNVWSHIKPFVFLQQGLTTKDQIKR